jgi:hypothetical protein
MKQSSGRNPDSNLEASPGSLLFLHNFMFVGPRSPHLLSGVTLAEKGRIDVGT